MNETEDNIDIPVDETFLFTVPRRYSIFRLCGFVIKGLGQWVNIILRFGTLVALRSSGRQRTPR
jgi:hypothetical protein